MNKRITPLRLVLAGLLFLLPTLVLILLSKGSVYDSERGLIRFANAFLTSYTLASLFLVLNMFQYSKSRRQPTAPWVSMVFAAILGVLVTFLLTTQGGFLMEETDPNVLKSCTTSSTSSLQVLQSLSQSGLWCSYPL